MTWPKGTRVDRLMKKDPATTVLGVKWKCISSGSSASSLQITFPWGENVYHKLYERKTRIWYNPSNKNEWVSMWLIGCSSSGTYGIMNYSGKPKIEILEKIKPVIKPVIEVIKEEEIKMITTTDKSGKIHVWKGDPNAITQIAQWKASYNTGYKPTIISPRNNTGTYTSDRNKTESFQVLSREEQAIEIATDLKKESKIPLSITQSLQKTLTPVYEKLKKQPHTAVDNRSQTGGLGSEPQHIMGMTTGKLAGVTIAGFIIILGLGFLNKTK